MQCDAANLGGRGGRADSANNLLASAGSQPAGLEWLDWTTAFVFLTPSARSSRISHTHVCSLMKSLQPL
eukprot:COSAG01_NODE_1900_length_8964_cov_121.219177_5_plen_69_part_00